MKDWAAGDASNRASKAVDHASQNPIHIKKSEEGSFTKFATERGMSVKQATSKVLANKDAYSPKIVKKANFSRNFGGN